MRSILTIIFLLNFITLFSQSNFGHLEIQSSHQEFFSWNDILKNWKVDSVKNNHIVVFVFNPCMTSVQITQKGKISNYSVDSLSYNRQGLIYDGSITNEKSKIQHLHINLSRFKMEMKFIIPKKSMIKYSIAAYID